jgi:hypothetical protein
MIDVHSGDVTIFSGRQSAAIQQSAGYVSSEQGQNKG